MNAWRYPQQQLCVQASTLWTWRRGGGSGRQTCPTRGTPSQTPPPPTSPPCTRRPLNIPSVRVPYVTPHRSPLRGVQSPARATPPALGTPCPPRPTPGPTTPRASGPKRHDHPSCTVFTHSIYSTFSLDASRSRGSGLGPPHLRCVPGMRSPCGAPLPLPTALCLHSSALLGRSSSFGHGFACCSCIGLDRGIACALARPLKHHRGADR
jgi:hypothetical protein